MTDQSTGASGGRQAILAGSKLNLDEIMGRAAAEMTKRVNAGLIALSKELKEEREEKERLRGALDRLGSNEAFTMSRFLDGDKDAELLARMNFARQALSTSSDGKGRP